MNLLLDPSLFSLYAFTGSLPPHPRWNEGDMAYNFFAPANDSTDITFAFRGGQPNAGDVFAGTIIQSGGIPATAFFNLVVNGVVAQSVAVPFNTITPFNFTLPLSFGNAITLVLGAVADSSFPANVYDRDAFVTPTQAPPPANDACYPPVCGCSLPACNGA